MVQAYSGLLITCDAPMKQYILHLDEQRQSAYGSFVVQDLDSTHILVKEESLPLINAKVDELLASNAFRREDAQALQPTKKTAAKEAARANPEVEAPPSAYQFLRKEDAVALFDIKESRSIVTAETEKDTGRGAFFNRDAQHVFFPVNGVRREWPLAKARQWSDQSPETRYETRIFVQPNDNQHETGVIVPVVNGWVMDRLSNVWPMCNQQQLTTEAYLLVEREKCPTQFINDGGFVRGETKTKDDYYRRAEERVNVEQLMVMGKGERGLLEVVGSAFVLPRPVKRGEEAFAWYGAEYWEDELGGVSSSGIKIRLPKLTGSSLMIKLPKL